MDDEVPPLPAEPSADARELEVDEQMRAALIGLEEWLDGDMDVVAATPLATEWLTSISNQALHDRRRSSCQMCGIRYTNM